MVTHHRIFAELIAWASDSLHDAGAAPEKKVNGGERAPVKKNPKQPDQSDKLAAILYLTAAKCLDGHGHLEISGKNSLLWDKLLCLQSLVRALVPKEIGGCLPLIPESYLDCLHAIWRRFDEEGNDAFSDSRAIGYAYQYFQLPSRKDAQQKIQTADKQLAKEQVVAFTQLYTPFWVVDFLVQNALLPQLPAKLRSQLRQNWLMDDSTHSPNRTVDSISILDPACGGGHFLHDGFATLVECHKLEGLNSQDAANKAMTQIHGADIDSVALHAAALTLLVQYVRSCNHLPSDSWNCFSVVDKHVLGSLSRAFPKGHPLNRQYSVVVTNPPYIGRRLITRELKGALKAEYPGSAHDLSAPFVVRDLELLEPGGRLGFITQASLMSLPSFEHLRQKLIESDSLKIAVELGTGVFPLQSGDKVNSVLLIAQAPGDLSNHKGSAAFIDLADAENKEQALLSICNRPKASSPAVFVRHLSEFIAAPSSAFHYKCPPAVRNLLQSSKKLEKVADVRQGLATTDNRRFLRYRWEVDESEIGRTWFPYVKGAGSERWTSPVINVVNFADNGREIKEAVAEKYPYLNGKTAWVVKNEQYYFRPGLCFSFVSTEQFGVRVLPAGCIFDVAASALFPHSESSDFLLAYLNSAFVRSICKLLNPTINMQVGDVKRIPLLNFDEDVKAELARLARLCVETKACLDAFFEPHFKAEHEFPLATILFSQSPHLEYAGLVSQLEKLDKTLGKLESSIDELVLGRSRDLQALSPQERESIAAWVSSNARSGSHLAMSMNLQQVAEAAYVQAAMKENLANHELGNLRVSRDASLWLEEALGAPAASIEKRLQTVAAKMFKNRLPLRVT